MVSFSHSCSDIYNAQYSAFRVFYMSRRVRKPAIWVPTRSDTNQAVQSQKMARSLKFWTSVEDEFYYPSENKGADQLRGYREADLRLCFLLCKLLVLMQ